jgi:hypothetical protein
LKCIVDLEKLKYILFDKDEIGLFDNMPRCSIKFLKNGIILDKKEIESTLKHKSNHNRGKMSLIKLINLHLGNYY